MATTERINKMTATIECSVNGKEFKTSFEISEKTPEYLIADEAYRVAILFAETQFIAQYGYRPAGSHEFAKFLSSLDYSYSID